MKVEASLGSGLNPNGLTTASIAANAITTIAARRILRVREFFMASSAIARPEYPFSNPSLSFSNYLRFLVSGISGSIERPALVSFATAW
jgi:hypothetical protein